MNYIILGSGAIGSLYGAMLSKRFPVSLIGRDAHVTTINNKGLKVSGKINEVFTIKAATKIKNIEENTAIILTTKVYDSENAIKNIREKLKEDTVIICLQNGYGIEEIVRKNVKCTVIRGITNHGATFAKPGEIIVPFIGYTKLEKSKDNTISLKIAEEFRECGLKTEISEDIQIDVWRKLLINCVLNPLTAILDVPNDGIKDLQDSMQGILDEIKKVLNQEGIRIPQREYDKVKTEYFSSNISSTLQDIRKGKRTEIDYINGAIVSLGKKYNIPTPINEMMVELVHAREKIAK